jgi:hypothetical protein
MSLWTPWRRDRESTNVSTSSVATATLGKILSEYDVVDVVANDGDPFVVVAERNPYQNMEYPEGTIRFAEPMPTRKSGMFLPSQQEKTLAVPRTSPSFPEMGTSVPSPFSSWTRQEYNSELQGLSGLEKYDKMRRGDATVRGTLRLAKTPVLSARWFMEPASDSVIDQNKAKFAWCCLTDYMSITWPQVLTEALLMIDFGYYMFEKVWTTKIINGKEYVVWQKLAPRHPMDVIRWHYDDHGGPAGVEMVNPNPMQDNIKIPIDKLLVFSFDKEAGNIEGLSILRSAYKHWYYKDKLYMIDAIQKERHGIGIPVIKLPMGFSNDDKREADQLGRNLRTNERAHVVLPPNWELIFAKLEGQPVDAMKSIDHHDKQIQKNILVAFMDGNAKEEDQTMFLKATRFVADIAADTFNAYGIPQLIDYNFVRGDKYPKLRARRIGEQADWRTLSFAIRNLIGAGVIRPDDKLEESIRQEMDLPKADPATIRETATPQAPGGGGASSGKPAASGKQNGAENPGQPRQALPSAKPPTTGGQDRSGG